MNDSLYKLRELTHKLPGQPFVKTYDVALGWTERDVDAGIAFTFACANEPGIIVEYVVASQGSSYPHTEHRVNEWLIVYDGAITVEIDDQLHNAQTGESAYIPAGQPHTVTMVRDTRLLAVGVPPAQEQGHK